MAARKDSSGVETSQPACRYGRRSEFNVQWRSGSYFGTFDTIRNGEWIVGRGPSSDWLSSKMSAVTAGRHTVYVGADTQDLFSQCSQIFACDDHEWKLRDDARFASSCDVSQCPESQLTPGDAKHFFQIKRVERME